jgi:hypothetical protein
VRGAFHDTLRAAVGDPAQDRDLLLGEGRTLGRHKLIALRAEPSFIARVASAFFRAAAVHGTANALHNRATELFDDLGRQPSLSMSVNVQPQTRDRAANREW